MLKVVVVMRVLSDLNSLRTTVLVSDWDSWLVLMVIGNPNTGVMETKAL